MLRTHSQALQILYIKKTEQKGSTYCEQLTDWFVMWGNRRTDTKKQEKTHIALAMHKAHSRMPCRDPPGLLRNSYQNIATCKWGPTAWAPALVYTCAGWIVFWAVEAKAPAEGNSSHCLQEERTSLKKRNSSELLSAVQTQPTFLCTNAAIASTCLCLL